MAEAARPPRAERETRPAFGGSATPEYAELLNRTAGMLHRLEMLHAGWLEYAIANGCPETQTSGLLRAISAAHAILAGESVPPLPAGRLPLAGIEKGGCRRG